MQSSTLHLLVCTNHTSMAWCLQELTIHLYTRYKNFKFIAILVHMHNKSCTHNKACKFIIQSCKLACTHKHNYALTVEKSDELCIITIYNMGWSVIHSSLWRPYDNQHPLLDLIIEHTT